MPLEYRVLTTEILAKDHREIEGWLNMFGLGDWTLKSIVPEFKIIILEREIAVNEKLREIQLKGDNDHDRSNQET